MWENILSVLEDEYSRCAAAAAKRDASLALNQERFLREVIDACDRYGRAGGCRHHGLLQSDGATAVGISRSRTADQSGSRARSIGRLRRR